MAATMENNQTLAPRSVQLVWKVSFERGRRKEKNGGKRKGCCQACWRLALDSSPSESLNRLHISAPATLLYL